MKITVEFDPGELAKGAGLTATTVEQQVSAAAPTAPPGVDVAMAAAGAIDGGPAPEPLRRHQTMRWPASRLSLLRKPRVLHTELVTITPEVRSHLYGRWGGSQIGRRRGRHGRLYVRDGTPDDDVTSDEELPVATGGVTAQGRLSQLSAINRRNAGLFDHLGGAQHDPWGYGKAKRLGGFEVHGHLKFCRELHRETPGLSPRRMRST